MPRLLLVVPFLLALVAVDARADEVKLVNPTFAEWSKNQPAGWTRAVGARRDPGTTPSQIKALEGGGIALIGSKDTNLWHMQTQRVPATPGEVLELSFTARSHGRKNEPGQYGSCYVGLVYRNPGGAINGLAVQSVHNSAWREDSLRARVPKDAASVDVALFLSQTGHLEVRRVALTRHGPEDSFHVLVSDMARHYSFFAPHKIDWEQVSEPHADEARKAKTPQAFVKAIQPMLAKLADGHIWIEAPDGSKTWTHTPRITRNFEISVVLGRLQKVTQVIRNVIAARTPEGYGYLALGTLQLTSTQYARVEKALRDMFDTKGIILDLRVNGGGQEVWGQRLCGLLAGERVLYARALMRAGPAYADFFHAGDRYVIPATSGRYEGPVVALVGPGCVSSGEGMAMMLKAMPGIPLVGLPTRGSSGNPQPVHLPNGVAVWYSRWVSQMPDGSTLERKGVPPDTRIEHRPGKDPALDEAVKILKAKAGKR